MNRVPRWRIAAAIGILVALASFAIMFLPIYVHNLQLQNYVVGLTQHGANQVKPEDALRASVVDKARQLSLPVTADDVHISRSAEGLRVEVRYFVRVDLPGYTVNLHFYPGAGSR